MPVRFVQPRPFNPLGLFGVFLMLFASAMAVLLLVALFALKQ